MSISSHFSDNSECKQKHQFAIAQTKTTIRIVSKIHFKNSSRNGSTENSSRNCSRNCFPKWLHRKQLPERLPKWLPPASTVARPGTRRGQSSQGRLPGRAQGQATLASGTAHPVALSIRTARPSTRPGNLSYPLGAWDAHTIHAMLARLWHSMIHKSYLQIITARS